MLVGRERRRILENVRVFFLFLRKRKVQSDLRRWREELVAEVSRLTQVAREGLP